MKIKKIPTILGLLVLIIGMVAGVFLIRYRQIFRLGASGSDSPKDVRVGNISDTSFTVSWTTEKEIEGAIMVGENQNNLNKVGEDELGRGFTHTTTLRNLTPETTYFFKVNSNGNLFDQEGIAWNVKTGPTLSGSPSTNLISGSLLSATGEPVQNGLIYISVGGSLFSTTTSKNGGWVIQLSQARSLDLSSFLVINDSSTLLEVSANAGPAGVSSAKVYPQSARPMPPMTLGQSQDFRNLSPNNTSGSPEASIDVPEGKAGESGFAIPSSSPKNSGSNTVTLKSIDEGEVVTSTSPEFFGNGPVGTTISIKVESEAQSTQLKIPNSGDWKWTAPLGLPEGTHKITITWKDTKGITRNLTKTFIVQAAEGPAFVATPSGTPTTTGTPTSSPTSSPKSSNTPSATSTATASPATTASASATVFPQPVSGSLTPTLLLTILGIGAIFASFFILKLSDT